MATSFHEKEDSELDKQLEEKRSELREYRFTLAVNRAVQSPAEVTKLKKDISRILTVKRERALGKSQVKPAGSTGSRKKK